MAPTNSFGILIIGSRPFPSTRAGIFRRHCFGRFAVILAFQSQSLSAPEPPQANVRWSGRVLAVGWAATPRIVIAARAAQLGRYAAVTDS